MATIDALAIVVRTSEGWLMTILPSGGNFLVQLRKRVGLPSRLMAYSVARMESNVSIRSVWESTANKSSTLTAIRMAPFETCLDSNQLSVSDF